MTKEAVSKISSVQLILKEELTCAKILHRKGDKHFLGLQTYDDDLIEYKGVSKFNSLEEFSRFIGKCISVSDDNKIWLRPQIRILNCDSFQSMTMDSQSYDTDEEAEKKFNELVQENNLIIK